VKVSRDTLLTDLKERQALAGGYTGTDIAHLSQKYGVTRQAIRQRIRRLQREDPAFRGLRYLSQRAVPAKVAVDDYDIVHDLLREASLAPPSTLVARLNEERALRGLLPLPERTAYRLFEQLGVGLERDRSDPLSWFRSQRIPVAPTYDLMAARASLDSNYAYSGLTSFYGLILERGLDHLRTTETHFASLYPGVSPLAHYAAIRPRANALPGFLAALDSGRAPAHQAKLVFELQALHLVEFSDFLLTQLRFRQGRIQQRLNSRFQKRCNELRSGRLEGIRGRARTELDHPGGDLRPFVEKLANDPLQEEDQARALLRLGETARYQDLREALSQLTRGFHPEEVVAHTARTIWLLRLARGEKTWEDVPLEDRPCLGKNRRLLEVVESSKREALLSTLLTERLLDALARGKLTLTRSWEFQDLGRLVAEVPLPEREAEWPLPPSTLQTLLDGTLPLDISPLQQVGARPPPPEDDADELDEGEGVERERFTPWAREVLREVRARNPGWLEEHRRVLGEGWQGAFRFDMTEEEFADKLVLAIGALGRNCRVRDDRALRSLDTFLQKYVTEATLDLLLRDCHRAIFQVTGLREGTLLTDTMGMEGRRTHVRATLHPRYGTLGFADMRGVGVRLVPLYSLPCPSYETEAQHAVEMVARANRVLDGTLRLYAGNGHTVSKVSAGLLLGAFGVISAGHVPRAPDPPRPGQVEYLREHLGLANCAFLLVQRRPELGRLFSSRSHVLVNDVNVRSLIESIGRLVIRRVKATGYDSRAPQPHIEASNHQKRRVMIMERGVTRAEPHRQGLHMMAGELILAFGAVRSALRGEVVPYPTSELNRVALFQPL